MPGLGAGLFKQDQVFEMSFKRINIFHPLHFCRSTIQPQPKHSKRLARRIGGNQPTSEEINRALLASTYDCIKVLDSDFILLSMNERGWHLMEIEDPEPYLNHSYLDFWSEDDKPRVRQVLTEALQGEQNSRFEGFCATAKGKPKWWEVRAVALPTNGPRTERLLVVSRDVTEQKVAQMALQQSQERLSLGLEFAGMAMWDADLINHIAHWSPQHFTLLGLEPIPDGLATVEMWKERVHPDDLPAVLENWREAIKEHKEYRIEYRIIRADNGHTSWVSALGRFIYDEQNQPIRFIGMLFDITDRKEDESSLEREHAFLREVIDTTPSMVFVKNWNGQFILANEALAHCYGTTIDDVVGKTDSEFNPHAEEIEHFIHDDREVISTRLEKHIPEEKVSFANGEVHWFSTIKVPLVDRDGNCDKLLGVATDITERKQWEEAMERFRIALDSAADNIFLIDPDAMKFIDVSQSACRDLGYSRDELLQLGPPQIMPQLSDEELRRCFEQIRCQPSGRGTVQTLHYRKDCTSFEVEVTLRPVEIQGRPLVIAVARDITEQKEAQEALRQSEQRLKLAQQAGRVGVFDWDIINDHAIVSSQLNAIFDVPAESEPATYDNWLRHVYPDDLPRMTDEFEDCIRERKKDAEFEYRIVLPDGETRWVDTRGQIEYTADNTPTRMIGTIVDITERRQAEDSLRESEEKFRALAENARASFGIVQDERFVYANPYFGKVSGFGVEELLRMTFPELVHPDFRPMMIERARLRQLGQPVSNHYDFAMLTKDGQKRWVEFSAGTIMYRGKPAIIGTGFDITERKRAQEALQLQNERLALLTESAAHLLKAEDPDTMILKLFEKVSRELDVQGYMNFLVNETGDALRLDSYAGIPEAAASQVLRLEFGQAVCGTVAQRRQPIHATSILQSDDEMVQLLKTLGIRAYACNPLMAGRRLLGTLAFATTTRDEFSQEDLDFLRTICQYVAMAKERLRLEEQLRRHIEQLASANAALADADKRKNEFLAMLAHELRNPLAPIRNAMELLRSFDLKDEIQQRQANIIDRQIGHMARLLNDLLDVSRITTGKVELNKTPLALREIFAHAIETSLPLIEAHNHTLTVTNPPASLQIMADMDRLAQALANLLSNAAKYTEDGGHIWFEAARENNQAVIRVRDTGVGIHPDLLPYIFDLFTQADHSLGRSQGGLGIGLTLVRDLVTLHGGTVEAHSAGLGQGSEFIVHLPLLTRDEAEAKPESFQPPEPIRPEPSFGQAPCRILVVDDMVDTADSMSELLEMWGYQVSVAYSGETALDVAREFQPEVVLLDVGLPTLSGYEVAQQLRKEQQDRPLLLVALTGYGREEDRQRAKDAGFDEHLVKPVDLDQLKTLISAPRQQISGA